MSAARKKNQRPAGAAPTPGSPTGATVVWWLPWALAVVAVTLALVAYSGVSSGPFVYDDRLTVVGNPSIRDLSNLRAIVLHDIFRPVVNLSYAMDFARSGLHPRAYHQTNVTLHLVNVVLLFIVALVLTRDRQQHETAQRMSDRAVPWLAFATASLFAVHPMMTEGVSYVSGRSELLCTSFFLVGFLALRKFLLVGGGWFAVLGGLAFVLGLGSKESAAMLPYVLLAAELLVFPGASEDRRRRLLRWHLPFAGIIAVAALIRVGVYLTVEQSAGAVSIWHNAFTEVAVVWRYLGLLVLPVGQSIMHPVETVTSLVNPATLLAFLGLAAVAAAVFFLHRRFPLVCFALLWFFLLLAPSHVIPLQEAMAEHRVYAASCGFFLGVAALALVALGKLESRRRLRPGWAMVAVLAAALVLLTAATSRRNAVWGDPVLLWGDAARKAPDTWGASYAWADALRNAGRCEEAVAPYRQAISLLPDQLSAHLNLGICLAELERFDEAYAVFERARLLAPENPKVHNNLGTLAARLGRLDEARDHLQAGIRADPRNIQARLSLVRLAESVFDDPAEALRLCREIRDLDASVPGVTECIERNSAAVALKSGLDQP